MVELNSDFKIMNELEKINQRKAAVYGKRLSNRPTKAEQVMIEILNEANIDYQFQKQFYDKNHCFIVDFYLKRDNLPALVIEVDGDSHKKTFNYDVNRTKWLRDKRNCRVLRFSNDKVLNDPESILIDILLRNVRFKKS